MRALRQECSWIECSHRFDFTLRFEHLVLSICPSAIFLVIVFWRLFVLSGSTRKTQASLLRVLKVTTTVLYAVTQLILLVLWSASSERNGLSTAASALSLILAVAIVGLSILEHDRSVRPSSVLLIYMLLSALFDATQLRTLLLVGSRTAVSAALSVTILLKLVFLALETMSKAQDLDEAYKDLPPESISSAISRAFLWWTIPIFRTGYHRLLAPVDIYPVDASMRSTLCGDRLYKLIARSDMSKRHAFLRVCLGCFRGDIALMIPARLTMIFFTYSQTFLLHRAITILSQPTSDENTDIGYALIGATFIIYLGIAISTSLYEGQVRRVMIKLRGAVVASVFSRALTAADGANTENAAITLISTDVDSIVRVFSELNESWAHLVEVIVGIVLLSRQVGAISVVPIVLAILSTRAQTFVSKHIGNRRKLWNGATQKRVGAASSIMGSIQSVRIAGLMTTTTEYLRMLRSTELGFASGFLQFVVGLNVIAVIPSIWAPVLTWIVYAIQARVKNEAEIDTAQAFTSLALLSLITAPTAKLLTIMTLWAQASACFERLQDYFRLETYVDYRDRIPQCGEPGLDVLANNEDNAWTTSQRAVIRVKNLTVSVPKSETKLINKVSFEIERGTIVVICGPPGSGKTTLLKALLGEVNYTDGWISSTTKSIAYCAQSPWMTDITIADFIRGPNASNDKAWYQQVISACDLAQDLQQLPEGDNTRIGSRGIALSGGQKARFALARATYLRKDILLLDDVLSSVDQRTESSIVSSLNSPESPFRTGRRTILAISHSTKLIGIADQVLCLKDGELTKVDVTTSGRLTDVVVPDRTREGGSQRRKGANNVAKPPSPDEKLELSRKTGDWTIYRYFFQTLDWQPLALFVACSVGIAFCSSFTQVWLQWWTDSDTNNIGLYLPVFAALACCSIFFTGANMIVVFLNIMPTSSARLHDVLLETVARAPYSLFYNTDTGTILNRFSQDMSLICNNLPTSLIATGNMLCETLASMVLISTGASYIGLVMPLVLVTIYLVQKVYLKTSRQLRYLDLERRSPLYSHFLETLEGVVTIRSFGWSEETERVNRTLLDDSQAPLHLLYCIQRWLRLVLDLTTMGLAVVVVALALSMRDTTSPGRIGLALTNILGFSQSLSRLITSWTTMEISIGSVARTRSFASQIADANQEKKYLEGNLPPNSSWPSHGTIEMSRVYAGYENNDDSLDKPCLKDINLKIKSGQKISICGRTGSGKTSLMLALVGALPLRSGHIFIDGIDITTLPQNYLQQRLIGVPQQAFIMPASVRYNLDPLGRQTDAQLLAVLSKVALQELITDRGGLDAEIDHSSLSQGQQQLFCLARALCREHTAGSVVVLDEATSNLDANTHRLVADLIASEFRDFTVILIAHRVDTILSADVAVFLDHARLVAMGPPQRLLRECEGFRDLCQQ